MDTSTLPRIVVALLDWLTPDPVAKAGLVGDLEERYSALQSRGPLARLIWLTSEVSAVAAYYVRERGFTLIAGLRQDLALAGRNLRRRPGFSGLVIATVALGIGANTAIFSVVNGLLISPLPYLDADRLVLINQRTPEGFDASVSLPNYRDWKERTRSFDAFSAILPSSSTLSRDDGTRVIETGWVHGGFFETLGVEPALGRFFTEAEAEPGASAIVVLSHSLWLAEFGGDPTVVGRSITLRGEPWTVVGVMSPEFRPYRDVVAYLPMGHQVDQLAWDDRGTGSGTEVFARLSAGISPAQAQAELEAVGTQIALEVGEPSGSGNLTPLRSWYVGDAGRQAVLLMAAVALVLLVACANVANLLMVNGERRRTEVAVRSALGATRGRVHRQLLTETLVFCVVGGTIGAAVAWVGVSPLLTLIGDSLPLGFGERVRIDAKVLLFAVVISFGAVLLAGLLPARASSRAELAGTLQLRGRGNVVRLRAREVLISAEVGISMMLLVGAGLFISSLAKLQNVDKGFDGSGVVTVRLQLSGDQYSTRDQWAGFHRQVREDISALPGVVAVATSNIFPLSGNSWEMLYRDENTPPGDRGESVLLTMVSPEFFEAYSIEVVQGRGFSEADRWGTPLVALVDETLADTRWPGQSPIGKQITFEEQRGPDGTTSTVWRTVVGVVRHVRHYELSTPSRIEVYTPIDQSVAWGFSSYVSVRAESNPSSLVPVIRQAVTDLDPGAPLYRIRTLEDVVDQELGAGRAIRELLIVFAALTLLLGCVGIYAVVSHVTAARVGEIAVRVALGGRPTTMVRLLVGDAVVPVLLGVVAGAIGAVALGRLFGSLLYEVDPADPAVITGAGVLLTVVAMGSAWIPARAATRVTPRDALMGG